MITLGWFLWPANIYRQTPVSPYSWQIFEYSLLMLIIHLLMTDRHLLHNCWYLPFLSTWAWRYFTHLIEMFTMVIGNNLIGLPIIGHLNAAHVFTRIDSLVLNTIHVHCTDLALVTSVQRSALRYAKKMTTRNTHELIRLQATWKQNSQSSICFSGLEMFWVTKNLPNGTFHGTFHGTISWHRATAVPPLGHGTALVVVIFGVQSLREDHVQNLAPRGTGTVNRGSWSGATDVTR